MTPEPTATVDEHHVPTEEVEEEIREVVEESFGHSTLLPGQAEALHALVEEGRDVLLISPTGSGKSLSYQAAGVLIEGITLVISPLLALQQDQIDSLGADREELLAARISSAETDAQREDVLARAAAGELEFVFLSPEQLANDEVRRRLAEIGPSLIAVDEAHCVSSWGHDFRPDYFRLGELLEELSTPTSRPRIIAMTATAAPPVRDDIVERLRMHDPELVVTGFERPNLALRVVRVTTPHEQRQVVLDTVAERKGSGIVYARTRRTAEEYAEGCAELGRTAAVYHAGLGQKARRETHEAFMAGEVELIVATSAFGMGIDKPDIRFVVHAQIPESPDTYYQEVGRAGRDGEPAVGILVYREEDLSLGRFFSGGVPKRNHIEAVLGAVGDTTYADGGIEPKQVGERTGLGPRQVGRILNLLELVTSGGLATDVEEPVAAVLDRAEAHRKLQRSRVEMMRGYAETDRCRADFVLSYFGEQLAHNCGICDNCTSGVAEESAVPEDVPFPVQAQVRHDEFGDGTVTDVEEDRVTVLFEDVGYRTLSLKVIEQHDLLELS